MLCKAWRTHTCQQIAGSHPCCLRGQCCLAGLDALCIIRWLLTLWKRHWGLPWLRCCHQHQRHVEIFACPMGNHSGIWMCIVPKNPVTLRKHCQPFIQAFAQSQSSWHRSRYLAKLVSFSVWRLDPYAKVFQAFCASSICRDETRCLDQVLMPAFMGFAS